MKNPISKLIIGELIQVGDDPASGLCRALVKVDVAHLKTLERVPLYRPVAIILVDELTDLVTAGERAAAAPPPQPKTVWCIEDNQGGKYCYTQGQDPAFTTVPPFEENGPVCFRDAEGARERLRLFTEWRPATAATMGWHVVEVPILEKHLK